MKLVQKLWLGIGVVLMLALLLMAWPTRSNPATTTRQRRRWNFRSAALAAGTTVPVCYAMAIWRNSLPSIQYTDKSIN